jgi:hypothetical protein
MSETPPSPADYARKAKEAKEKRLAEALRANLHRRKGQTRARAEEAEALPEKSSDQGE